MVETYKSQLKLYHFSSKNLEMNMTNPIKYRKANGRSFTRFLYLH